MYIAPVRISAVKFCLNPLRLICPLSISEVLIKQEFCEANIF